MEDFTATLRPGTPRYQEWLNVLGSNEIILKSPLPALGNFPGIDGPALYYELDLNELTDEQRERLINHLSEKFEVPRGEVAAELDTIGCPILGDGVIVTVHNPQRWM